MINMVHSNGKELLVEFCDDEQNSVQYKLVIVVPADKKSMEGVSIINFIGQTFESGDWHNLITTRWEIGQVKKGYGVISFDDFLKFATRANLKYTA